jgi:hypothetical protein
MVRMGATGLDIYYIYTTPYIITHPKSYVKEQHPRNPSPHRKSRIRKFDFIYNLC